MQDFSEKVALLKRIKECLDEMRELEKVVAEHRVYSSNTTARFRLSPNTAVTNTALIVFRQHVVKMRDAYLAMYEKAWEITDLIDQIQP